MQIYYFSRTGRSEKIAKELAEKQGGEALPITDGKSWDGAIGYIKAGYNAASGKNIAASYQKPAEGETVAVVFPVWAGTFPPAVKAFITEVGRQRIMAIPTSLGSVIKDRDGFVKVIDLVGKDICQA